MDWRHVPVDYAVIEIGGSQQRVAPGDTIRVSKLPAGRAKEGEALRIDRVLMVRADGALKVGSPVVTGAVVKATVLGEAKGKKILVFKKKRRKQYRRTKGHRQAYTLLRIEEIQPGS